MNKKENKLLILGITTGLIILTSSFMFLKKPNKEENKKLLTKEETKSMLSYTLDGQKTDIKPTKGSGYIANKIICENGSNLIWDNTNWEVEIISLESNDICTVDFTTNASTSGYRVTATTNVEGSIDSLSKATIENGTIIFYPNKGQEITSVNGCSNGKLENNKVIVSNITSNQTCNIIVKYPTLYSILTNSKYYDNINTRSNFNETHENIIASRKTIYKESLYKENGKDVYYFSGNVADNWVKFAGFYWRIIRTNEDGSIRLLYAGTTPNATNSYIEENFEYNSSYDNTMYVGYMYGSTDNLSNNRINNIDSSIKRKIDNWYINNINENYDKYVSKTAIYCNDRSGGNYSSRGMMYYAAYQRLAESSKHPSYKCGSKKENLDLFSDNNVADKFSKSTSSGGNGQLEYPVGLMTADEVAFAGGLFGNTSQNTYYYLNSLNESSTGNKSWWTMTPFYADSDSDAHVFSIGGTNNPGILSFTSLYYYTNAVRPVLSLKSCVLVSRGDGTPSKPYEIEIESACATAEN